MSKQRILVIEDEEDILALIHFNLIKAGFRVECAATGEEGYKMAIDHSPDLIILDLMLPNMDGHEVCKRLRETPATKESAIIMLTAKGEEGDIVRGLEQGADDYIPKPFSPQVLLARVRAVLRRRGKIEGAQTAVEPIEIHDLFIHPGRNRVVANGEAVELTFTEFKILSLLATRPGWVFTRSQIVDAIHGEGYAVTDRAVDVQIVGLRKKLGRCGAYIETVRGVGYRFKE
ncbi:MAG: response regulator transcription factor [Deltaproteobacteria bacterium]|jgi:two-component system phosphate regulon response regulator PhoB|nr:response regulator transcription factor [Deltaproteobacteria bacterium]